MAAPFARKKQNYNRVWTLDELSIFDELQKPVAVVISSVYDSCHRYLSCLPLTVLYVHLP